MSFEIRPARLKDIDAICVELEAFSDHYSTKMPPYKDKETSSRVLTDIIEKHLFLVAVDESGTLVGFIAGFVCDHIYNPDIRTLAEAFWWTKPEHRRTGIGLVLFEAFKKWGEENVDWVLMTIEQDTPIDEKIITSRGFRIKKKSYMEVGG